MCFFFPIFVIWREPRKSSITSALGTGLSNWLVTTILITVSGESASMPPQHPKHSESRTNRIFMLKLSQQWEESGTQRHFIHQPGMIEPHDAAAIHQNDGGRGACAKALEVGRVERDAHVRDARVVTLEDFRDEGSFFSGRRVVVVHGVAVALGGRD